MNIIDTKVFEGVKFFKLGSNLLWAKPKMFVYSYLVDGLLIDTGQALIRKPFLKLLENEHVEKIILTHHHEDHSGNVEAIKKLKNIEAYGSAKCVELMKNPVRIEPARYVTWGQHTKAAILPLDINQAIKTAKYTLEILETPGHAIDQLSFYEADQGWLFSGDLYVNDFIRIFMRDENIYQQMASIKRLLQLDFEVLFCNHQPILRAGKDRLQSKLQFLEDFTGQVRAEYQHSKDVKAIMKNLGLKEQWGFKIFSLGQLSQLNMVRSVIEDQV